VIALADLLEAEGRALRRGTVRMGAGLAMAGLAALLAALGMGLVLWGIFQGLVHLWGEVVAALAAGALLWRTTGDTGGPAADVENPFRLGPALLFGAIFAAVLVVSEYANAWLGASGVYATAFVSGLADVDAITLTLSKLAAEGSVAPGVATTGIVLAAVANTLVKAGLAWVLGTRELGRLVTAVLAAVAAVGLVVAVV